MTDDLTIGELEEMERLNRERTQGMVRVLDLRPRSECLTIAVKDAALARIANDVRKGPLNEEDEANADFFTASANLMHKVLSAARRGMEGGWREVCVIKPQHGRRVLCSWGEPDDCEALTYCEVFRGEGHGDAWIDENVREWPEPTHWQALPPQPQ